MKTSHFRRYSIGVTFLLAAIATCAPFAAAAQTLGINTICNGPDCDFNDLLELGKRLINYLVVISVIITAIVIALAGFKMVSNQGNPGKRSEATKMLGKVVTGFAIILASWLIIQAITGSLLKPGFAPGGMTMIINNPSLT